VLSPRALSTADLEVCAEFASLGFDCDWHGRCALCRQVIHLCTLAPGSGQLLIPRDEAALMVVGEPPLCVECRGCRSWTGEGAGASL
jgi:hypothetical protein